MSLADQLRELEQMLLTAALRKDPERLLSVLAEDFREFGSSGRVYSRAEIIAALQTEAERWITIKELACLAIAGDVALVTYRSVSAEQNSAAVEALRSSLWVYRDARWQMLFHQGTRVTT